MLEDVVTNLKTTLQTSLPSKLDTIETERGDGIVLDDIAHFSITGFEKDDYFACPALFVLGEGTPTSIEVMGNNKKRATHTIIVIIIVEDIHEETIYKKLLRYCEAVERIIFNDKRLGNTVHSALITKTAVIEGAKYTTTSSMQRAVGLVIEVIEDYLLT